MMNDNSQKSAEPQPVVAINFQYIKDLSFENPHSPLALAQVRTQPQINVTIDIKANTVEKERYEVVLKISAKAVAEEKTVYIAELAYAAITTIQHVAEENLERALLIYVPSLLVPFVRSIMANLTREAGLPPLMLEPIDFTALYMMKKSAA